MTIKYGFLKTSWQRTVTSLALALCCLSAQAETVIVEKIVAVVEDDIILTSELMDRTAEITAAMQAQRVTPPPAEELNKQALDKLIEESIQLRMGSRFGVRISDAQLNNALNRIASRNRMTLEELRQALQEKGESYEKMREKMRRDMIIQRVQEGSVNQLINITDQEIDNFLASEEGRQLVEEEYFIVHALLPLTEDNSPEDIAKAKNYIDDLYQQIASGGSFEKLIPASKDYKFQGGELGWRKRRDLPSLFLDVAPTLEVGQTAAPIKSASGFHLVKLVNKRGGETIVPQTYTRHILLKASEIRSLEESRELAAKLRERALDGEDFADLARQYSDDIGSAQEGGDLDWVNPGQMVREFQQAMDATEVGAISEPFESQFGWHILQVQDRRQHDMTETVARNVASNFLRQRKYQEELQVWLQKIRDEAFVDIK